MGTTPINLIPYPDGTDAPDITQHFADASDVIDYWTVKRFANAAERDGYDTTPQEGEIDYLADGGFKTYKGVDEGWVSVGQSRTILKTSTESTTSTTLQDDDVLQVTLPKNGTYDIEMNIIYSSDTASDSYALFAQLDAPTASPYMAIYAAADAGIIDRESFTSVMNVNPVGTTVGFGGNQDYDMGAIYKVLYTTGATDETFKFRWCVNTSAAPGATANVHAGSTLTYRRTA